MNQLPIGSEIVSNASEDLGYKHGDYNGHYNGEEVLYRGQGTHKNGLRADSYSSYISDPGLDKKEILKVLTFSLVKKVLFDDKKTAIGIQLERFGETFNYYASKEVILASGSIGSPKLLMLSGVGPKEHLREHDIKPLVDLPGEISQI